jgi:hypothetical protein
MLLVGATVIGVGGGGVGGGGGGGGEDIFGINSLKDGIACDFGRLILHFKRTDRLKYKQWDAKISVLSYTVLKSCV